MLGKNKNLRDTSKDSIKDTSSSPVSLALWRDQSRYYNKTNKLITALYMVTDTIDKDEPLRLKLRTLGVEILSDTSTVSNISKTGFDIEKITTILSFLNIAFDVGMISEMNCNIIRKEFVELKQSIQEFTAQNHLWFEEFVSRPSKEELHSPHPAFGTPLHLQKNGEGTGVRNSKGQGTRIGVQKGSTLMKALNRVSHKDNNFELLKQQRRELIIKIIKNRPDGISIKDIILGIRNLGEEAGEKTIQRELISMVKDNVLKKTGEKRWSLYFLN
ncbi:MAG: hypothetical protein AAB913_00060 [Patescibacteria group bacterium]